MESDEFYCEGDSENPVQVLYSEKFLHYKDEIKRLARASGIYLIDSTQTPRKEVLPPVYRGQFSAFLAFRTSRPEESRICLANQYDDAVKLLGAGDGLYLDNQGLERIQSVFITPEEVDTIVAKVIQTYGSREQWGLEEAKKCLEETLNRSDMGKPQDSVSGFQGFRVSEVQESSTPDTYRDYVEIRKYRSGIPTLNKKQIFKQWGYHTTQHQEANERYMSALAEHGAEWVLELAKEKKANAGTIASIIWCVRRNDGVVFDNVVAKIHEILDAAEDEFDE
jgi:DNA segregation ATPase FtsK/SpoIIIE-like protein